MQAILKCLKPSFLSVPNSIASLIPPRPAGYEFTRELFKKKTGLAFDQLAPAEAAADLALSFLFHPERINRLVQHGENGEYGFTEMANSLVNATFKATRLQGMERSIQMQTEQIILTYFLSSSIDEQLSFPARTKVAVALAELKTYFEGLKKTEQDAIILAHLNLLLERFKSPEKVKPTLHAAPPPGAPIGCEEMN
jgi:hypothetical protein